MSEGLVNMLMSSRRGGKWIVNVREMLFFGDMCGSGWMYQLERVWCE